MSGLMADEHFREFMRRAADDAEFSYDERAALEADHAAARAEVARLQEEVVALRKRAEEAEAKVEKLRKALDQWGHDYDCDVSFWRRRASALKDCPPCNCNIEDVLKETAP